MEYQKIVNPLTGGRFQLMDDLGEIFYKTIALF